MMPGRDKFIHWSSVLNRLRLHASNSEKVRRRKDPRIENRNSIRNRSAFKLKALDNERCRPRRRAVGATRTKYLGAARCLFNIEVRSKKLVNLCWPMKGVYAHLSVEHRQCQIVDSHGCEIGFGVRPRWLVRTRGARPGGSGRQVHTFPSGVHFIAIDRVGGSTSCRSKRFV